VQVLVWNYHDDLVTVAASPVQLTVKVPSTFGSTVTVSHMRVDETHGDAYTVWTSQGSPAKPSAAQIQALQQAMDPMPLNPPQSMAVSNGSVSVNFDLPRFGISLLTITPGAGVSDAGSSRSMPTRRRARRDWGRGWRQRRDGGGGRGGTAGAGAGGGGVDTGDAGGPGGAVGGGSGGSGTGSGGVSGRTGGGSASSGGVSGQPGSGGANSGGVSGQISSGGVSGQSGGGAGGAGVAAARVVVA